MTSVQVALDVPATMRDGVTLMADVYRPAGDGPWPTLLVRTPYGKGVLSTIAWNGLSPVECARRGLMVVVQDTRGRFASEGAWEPCRHEAQDGVDTIAWAAELPGSNGRVGMFGGSYSGNTQWVAAMEQPPALAAITPFLTWSEPMEGLVSRGGATELALPVAWSLVQGFDWLFRDERDPADMMAAAVALMEDIDGLPNDGYLGLPVHDLPVMRRHRTPPLAELDAVHSDSATQHLRVVADRVTVPVLHTAGWFDIFGQGTLDNHIAMQELGRPSRLIVGPWPHENGFVEPLGEAGFRVAALREAEVHPSGDWAAENLAFLQRHLLSDGTADGGPAVRLFVMGANEWRDEDAWPLERAETQRWYLHGDGGLSPEPPVQGGSSEVVYDPADPVPTRGGAIYIPAIPAGPVDQAPIEIRDDVLVFTSAVLEEDLEVTGRVRVTAYVESSAPSADWVARLCDVHPDGRSFNLCDGIVRVVEGAESCRAVEIDLWSTSNVFLAGHRLRVQVTNSCFPRWDRNLSTGDQRQPHYVTARQRLHHSADRPSCIVLPIVRASASTSTGDA